MHELSIATAIVEQAGEIARADGAGDVSSVTVRVGELAGVVPDALHFAFEVARDGTALAAARLVVERVPAQAWCGECAEEFALGMPPFFWCPRCDRPSRELRSGRELEITGVEAVPVPP
ncbi:hydrogenase maturation nickel metallochaperone HypA [Streptomyces dangxiongensis]|uniref:Hydrogenase maturation factor HypA n=1 Tax=Streptomyces dangxiongensis TaxID=1442032 RepID=A0A3G2JKY1_9ACTN|nr:hydrogenase maturation nickel metallochaperone HypA [Streptomyces dangxiongensis]AYN43043.1 hydrogenase maturation nickel metallochaperone HypA [Streptomyces dangxiongensis]